MVRIRLAAVAALAGSWDHLLPWLGAEQLRTLRQLHEELRPKLRVAIAPTSSRSALRKALLIFTETLRRFNRRWIKFVREVDLTAVNVARDKYNRYYLLEKECVVGSAHLARRGFSPLDPLTLRDVESALPPLPEVVLSME
jgi:hypothetical protein